MRVCLFGAYQQDYPRTSSLARGLAGEGVELVECRARGKSKVFRRYLVLLREYLQRGRRCSCLFVPSFRHKDVPLAWLLARLSGKRLIFDPLVSRFETKVEDRSQAADRSFQAWYNQLIDRVSLRLPDLVLADTEAHASYYRQLAGVNAGKVRVLPVGFDEDLFQPRREGGSGESVVLFYGSYAPLHGVETIVEAAALLVQMPLRFRLVGSGQTRPRVEARLRTLGLGNVELLPPVPYEHLPRLISEAQVCLGIFGSTPKAARVVPAKVYQCLAMGRPVVCRDSPALRELNLAEPHLYLVRPADPEALAEGIRKALAAGAAPPLGEFLRRYGSRTLAGRLKVLMVGASPGFARHGGSAKVLMVHSEESWRGGEAQLELLIRGLRERGWEVDLAASPRSPLVEKVESLGVSFHPLKVRGDADPIAALRLRRLIAHAGYSIVHCHSSHAHGATRLALATAGKRPAVVVSRRVDFPITGNPFSRWKYLRGVDLYLAISAGVREVLIRGGVESSRIVLVPSGIDMGKFEGVASGTEARRRLGIGGEEVVIGNVAALAPHKAHEYLLRAAQMVLEDVPRARFVIVGEGERRAYLEKVRAKLGLEDRVLLMGFREDVLDIMASFDCFVLSSVLEGLCTSLMDAQAMGIPVVATSTGGVPDLVEDGVSGLLVPPGDPGALRAAILRMLSDGELRARCIEGGKIRARDYGYEHMVEGTVKAYQKLLSPRG